MKTISNHEYEEYRKYKDALRNGRILTPHVLDMICQSFDNNPYEVGKHMIECNQRFQRGEHHIGVWL